ncbi:MAG: MoaD/ThiS family protein [Alphaproteobacteria bacterium]|nr:MAG: MoaD/ThiS family protein [Alphaproteobacteria bacterium]
MKILFFGRLADSLGRELELDVPETGCTVAELRGRLAGAVSSPGVRACIDRVIVADSARVLPHHEVAFVPPLSGG